MGRRGGLARSLAIRFRVPLRLGYHHRWGPFRAALSSTVSREPRARCGVTVHYWFPGPWHVATRNRYPEWGTIGSSLLDECSPVCVYEQKAKLVNSFQIKFKFVH